MNNDIFLLYRFKKREENSVIKLKNPFKGKLKMFSPFNLKWLFRLFLVGEKKNLLKVFILAIYDFLFSFSKQKVRLYVYLNEKEIFSYLAVQHVKYHMPWIVEEGLEIGAVYTLPKYRGKGLYSYSLETLIKNDKRAYFMIVDSENIGSIKGIEKAGFQYFKSIYKKTKNKIYPNYE